MPRRQSDSTTSRGDSHIIADLKKEASRREYIAALGVLSATTLAGCTGGKEDTNEKKDSEDRDAQAQEGAGDGVLNIGMEAQMQTWDPHLFTADAASFVLSNVYESLFKLNNNFEIVPQIAEDLQISDDGLTWTIPIKQGVQFHPPADREVVAEDVVYSLNRVGNEETGSPNSFMMGEVENVSAVDEYTVQLQLSQKFAPLRTYLAYHGMAIIPEESVEEFGGSLKEQAVGTNFLSFDSWSPGETATLTTFDDYRKDVTDLEEVNFSVIPEPKTAVTELQTGDVEFISRLASSQVSTVENDSSLEFIENEVPYWIWAGFDYDDKPTSVRAVRHAVSEAINREALVEIGADGYGQPTQGPWLESQPWYTDYKPYSTNANPERARQLLEDSDEVSTPVEISVLGNSNASDIASTSETIVEFLNQAGFDAELELVEQGTFFEREHNNQFDIVVNGWTPVADPDRLYLGFHSEGVVANEWLKYSNPEVDELFERGRVALDQEERQEIYKEAFETIIDDAPILWLYFSNALSAHRTYVEEFEPHPLGRARYSLSNMTESSKN